jgi:hypothetical protein
MGADRLYLRWERVHSSYDIALATPKVQHHTSLERHRSQQPNLVQDGAHRGSQYNQVGAGYAISQIRGGTVNYSVCHRIVDCGLPSSHAHNFLAERAFYQGHR